MRGNLRWAMGAAHLRLFVAYLYALMAHITNVNGVDWSAVQWSEAVKHMQ